MLQRYFKAFHLFLCLAALLLLAPFVSAQAQIPVSGSRIKDNVSQPFSGQLRFTVTDTNDSPVTYTPQGGTATTAQIIISVINGAIQNVGGFPPTIPNPLTMSPANTRYRLELTKGPALLTFPLININTSSFSVDGYIIQLTMNASGTVVSATGHGMPQWPCGPGATYNDLDNPAPYPWVCSQLSTDNSIVWTQNPSLNPMCQKGNSQAIGSPINAAGPPFCLNATIAWATPGYVYAGPTPNTVTPGQIGMVPISQLCSGGVCGAGATPAGNLYEYNAKLNTSTFTGTGFYGDLPKSIASTAVPTFSHYARNSPFNGNCGRNCGHVFAYYQDTPVTRSGGDWPGFGQTAPNYTTGLYTELGLFNGYFGPGTYNQFGGGVVQHQREDIQFNTNAIAQAHGANTYCNKGYDCAWSYSYFWDHGGAWTGGDEGDTLFAVQGGNYYQHQSGFTVVGNPAQGATTVTGIFFSGKDMTTGMYVFNNNLTPLAPLKGFCNITNYDPANHMLTVTAGCHTTPTTVGTTTANISIPNPNANGTSLTINVAISSGPVFTIDPIRPLIFVCDTPQVEFVTPTSVVDKGDGTADVTASFDQGHPAGCYVQQGDANSWGSLDMVADRIGNNWKTSYFVYGATDSTHIREVSYAFGQKAFINTSHHNFGGGQYHVTNAQVSRTGSTVKVCSLGQQDYGFGGQYIKLSGFVPADLNGVFQLSVLDANFCGTFTSAGTAGPATTVGAVDTGGAVNSNDESDIINFPPLPGTGAFVIRQVARVRQLGTTTTTSNGVTTNALNGTVSLYPNSLTMANGNAVLALDDMQNKTDMIKSIEFYDTAPGAAFSHNIYVNFTGDGVQSNRFVGMEMVNTNAWTKYLGGGGTPGLGPLPGPTFVQTSGPSGETFYVQAPLPRGKSFHIYKNPMMGTGIGSQIFFPLFVDGISGGGGGMYFSYNPDTGTTVFSSGKGDGIASSLSFTPTTMTFAASGGVTFVNPVTASNLAGVGTRAVTASSTGVLGTAPLGTVSSVAITMDPWATVTGSPITTSGTINLSLPPFGGSGASHHFGIVPDPGATAGTIRYLNENGGFVDPLTGGITNSFSITTPTGTCNFTYTKGILTAKTGSC